MADFPTSSAPDSPDRFYDQLEDSYRSQYAAPPQIDELPDLPPEEDFFASLESEQDAVPSLSQTERPAAAPAPRRPVARSIDPLWEQAVRRSSPPPQLQWGWILRLVAVALVLCFLAWLWSIRAAIIAFLLSALNTILIIVILVVVVRILFFS